LARVIKAVWLLFAVALGVQARAGADFGRYSEWPKAFSSSNILRIKSTVLSPVGVPMTHWSHAPGLITDAIARTLIIVPSASVGIHAAAWLSAIAFWWAMIGIARLVTRGDPPLFAWALAAAFIGTQAGFYSIFHSSEIFSLATFAVAMFWALSAGPARLRDSLIIGIACGLLLIVRVNLAMYVLLPLSTRVIVVWRGHGNRLNRAAVLHAFALGLPLLVYGAQLLVFNYWMTGSASKSPYVYGDETFRSVDFAHPMIGTMLFHSWHGLLTYHPLFALGVIALAALAVRRDSPLAERLLAGGALLALLAQLYVQASWWCWWNGMETFGNRTLSVGAVPVVIGLARWLYLLQQSATSRSRICAVVVLILSAAACLWSFLLYLQGHTNFFKWQLLLHAQRDVLRDPNAFVPVCVALVLSLGFVLFAFRRLRTRAVFAAVSALIATLAAHGLLIELVRGRLSAFGVEHFPPSLLWLMSALAFTVMIYLIADRHASPNPIPLARTAVAGGLLVIFVVGSWSFYELAVETKSVIAHSTAKPRKYRYRSTMVLDDLLACLPEYDLVEGFDARKLTARRFLEGAALEARQKITKR